VKPLLVIDGDSLAHRAYHALPKTFRRAEQRPGNALLGFSNFLVRLWDSEQPRAVLVGWDTLDQPTYRHELFAGYQAGRVFDAELLEQLDLLPELVRAFGFVAAKAPGFEADDFLAAAVQQEESRGGNALVVTSDRDSFQLASERTTILQPTRGVSELARVGPAEVRERYGVDPSQVPDFIALRGDPSDRLPGAPGVGPKKAAEILGQYGSLEEALEAGRFGARRAWDRRRPPTFCGSTGRSRPRLQKAASRRRRTSCASTSRWRRSTRRPPCPTSATRRRRGRRPRATCASWG
jgi:DNA polymerase-1